MLIGLLIYLENYKCSDGLAKCQGPSPTYLCIREWDFCDGRNDCGNNWDEERETCGQLSYL